MPATVDIIMKGVGLCYRKKDVWKVLFPFNDCHTVKFSHRKDDEKLEKEGSLKEKCRKIDINISPARQQQTATHTTNFIDRVLDLTHTPQQNQVQGKPAKVKTHGKVKVRGGWNETSVRLSIQNAEMSVLDYIQDYTDEDIVLVEDNGGKSAQNSEQKIDHPLVHWLKARVTLNQNERLKITRDGSDFLEISNPDNSSPQYTLIFDNDCVAVDHKQNDSDMFYLVIKDSDGSKRQFRITTPDQSGKQTFVIPPNLRESKPCMLAYASDPGEGVDSLPD